MYKIAVIGDAGSVLGFAALGIDAVAVTDEQDAKRQLKRLADEEYAVIYITEQLAGKINDEIRKYDKCLMPAIVLIPGTEGSLGIGLSNISASIERAVGADILGD